MIDLTLHCPTCGRRADMCFDHGDQWKKRPASRLQMTDTQLRAGVNEFTEDDPPPYGLTDTERAEVELELATVQKHLAELQHIEPIPGNEGRREWSIAVARRQVRELERMLAA